MELSAEHLLSIARTYWPSTQDYQSSPEVERFWNRAAQEFQKMDQWREFLRALGEELPGLTLANITTTRDACFSCAAYLNTGRKYPWLEPVVVGCVSILAPVYTVYGVQFEYNGAKLMSEQVFFEPLPPEMRAPADVIARNIEATFGVQALPRELAETPIPLFVDPREPPDTTLFHALFTSLPERVP
jgi:hypothetical protein